MILKMSADLVANCAAAHLTKSILEKNNGRIRPKATYRT